MGDITILTMGQVLTPEDQIKLLNLELQDIDEAINVCEDVLKGLPQEELMKVYAELMKEEDSDLKNGRLNNIATLLGRRLNKGMER